MEKSKIGLYGDLDGIGMVGRQFLKALKDILD